MENDHFFFGTFISDSSITGAGPEMPPSFLMRQKCTAINIDATKGMPMQCQMYARSKAFASTIEPPSKPKRTSLYGVNPNCAPNGPSCPSNGVARAMLVPTVTAQKPSWSSGKRYPVNESSKLSTGSTTPTHQLNSRGRLYEPVNTTRNMCNHVVITIKCAAQRCILRNSRPNG